MSDDLRGPLSFERPPVAEVALAVQFAPLSSFGLRHAGSLLTEFRSRFPRAEEYPALPPLTENFDESSMARVQISVESVSAPASPRYWFMDETGVKLIQVQHDRFGVNWRRYATGATAEQTYPSYKNLRETFRDELDRFVTTVDREGLQGWAPNLCEISYVNELAIKHAEIPTAIALWNPPTDDRRLSSPEDATIMMRYVIRHDDGHAIGRLHFYVQPAIRAADSAPVALMTITAHVRPEVTGLPGVMPALDLGHSWAIHAFTTLTTAQIQETWGIQHGS